jgi:prolyl-tRNA synthetase
MGALIMTHSDDYGLVLPPKLAPIHVAIVPIYKGEQQLKEISVVANEIVEKLKAKNIKVKFDDDDKRKPGWKFAEYEMKGVPLRIAIGPRDLENGTLELARRDTLEKKSISQVGVEVEIASLLEEIQLNLFKKAEDFAKKNTFKADTLEELSQLLDDKGGFVLAHWDGTKESELKIKEKTKATIRCVELDSNQEEGVCILSGKPSRRRVVFARAY